MGGGTAVPAVSFLFPGVVVLHRYNTDSGGELRGRYRGPGTAGAPAVSPAGHELRFLPGGGVWHLSLVGDRHRVYHIHRYCECL